MEEDNKGESTTKAAEQKVENASSNAPFPLPDPHRCPLPDTILSAIEAIRPELSRELAIKEFRKTLSNVAKSCETDHEFRKSFNTLEDLLHHAKNEFMSATIWDRQHATFKFSKISNDHIAKDVRVTAFISGESETKAITAKLTLKCEVCNFSEDVDLVNMHESILYGLVSNSKKIYDVLASYAMLRLEGECKKNHGHVLLIVKDEQAVYNEILLRDSDDDDELTDSQNPSVSHAYRGYIFCPLPYEKKDVICYGRLYSHARTHSIEMLIVAANESSESIKNFELSQEQTIALTEYFCRHVTFEDFKRLAEKNNPRIAGRVIPKLAALLTWASPEWVILNRKRKAGTVKVFFYGDGRTGKGEVGNYLRQKIGLARHASGETSTRTGITYTIDRERGIVIWGVLVEADRGLVNIEAMHAYPPEDLVSMREVLVQQKIEVRRSSVAKANARTRIIADSNTKKPMQTYLNRSAALRDIRCFQDEVDFTRWDAFIPFARADVDHDSRVEAALNAEDDEEFLSRFKTLVLWCWSRKPEQFLFENDAMGEASGAFRDIFDRFSNSEMPVIHEDSLASILRIAAAFAALSFSTTDGISVIIKKPHVELAKQFLEEVLQLLELEDYMVQKGLLELSSEQYSKFKEEINKSEVLRSALAEIAQHPSRSETIAGLTKHDSSYIRQQLGNLSPTFVRTSKDGYLLSPLGTQAWKKLKDEGLSATMAPTADSGLALEDIQQQK